MSDLATKITRHKTLAETVTRLQTEYDGKEMPPNVATEFEAAAKEAIQLQNEIKAIEQRNTDAAAIRGFTREPVGEPLVPDGGTPSNGKGATGPAEPAAYISIGESFLRSPEFAAYKAAGMPFSPSGLHVVDGSLLDPKRRFLPIDGKRWREEFEGKAVPTLGTGVISAQRIAEVIRSVAVERLVIRDILTVTPTSSNLVEIARVTSALPAFATPVAESGTKPEATIALDVVTVPIRTLAVHMPVTEQQLSDLPQIRSIIDDELSYDLARLEEYQIIWGDGTGQNLLGVMSTSGVTAGRTEAGDTLLDKIRRAATDVGAAGLEPTGIVIHPIDKETLDLTKGTDEHYLFQSFPDAFGRPRVWGMAVVETPAAVKYRAADATDQRVVLVGDWRRGAALYDRQQTAVAVGYINDQFIKNQRTIRAEERVGFGVKRAFGFKYVETQAAVP